MPPGERQQLVIKLFIISYHYETTLLSLIASWLSPNVTKNSMHEHQSLNHLRICLMYLLFCYKAHSMQRVPIYWCFMWVNSVPKAVSLESSVPLPWHHQASNISIQVELKVQASVPQVLNVVLLLVIDVVASTSGMHSTFRASDFLAMLF